jgi:anaerobic selenocysteine-containing dehydrogenase
MMKSYRRDCSWHQKFWLKQSRRLGNTGSMNDNVAMNLPTSDISTDTADTADHDPEEGNEGGHENDRIVARTCPLCEATCGLEITIRDNKVRRIRGDRDDVFSKGFICPKGSTVKDLDNDPDRIRVPMIREGRTWREASWEEAFAEIDRGLNGVRNEYGNDAVALYFGNPTAHNLSGAFYNGALARALRTKHIFSASTVDQMPKQVSAGLMFGTVISIPVPDIDRTDYLLMLGANPYESNGSLMTAPDMPGRIEALTARGGKLVVVDPRRTKTAQQGEHVAIRPGTDGAFLLSLLHVVFAENRVNLGACAAFVNGLDEIRELAASFSPEETASFTGIEANTTARIARELCDAKRAAVYGRIGTCTQEFGTIASWLIDVLNVVTGNLDREGGAMFARPAVGSPLTRGKPGKGRGVQFARWSSRVRNAPEVYGEFPAAVLAEEIETPGEGKIRALITLAGNPILSTPHSDDLDRAIASLDFMVSVDIYLNETTKHANVLLPAPRILTRSHFDVSLYTLAIRNVANWSAPVFELNDDERYEWETILRLVAIVNGKGVDVDVNVLDEQMALDAVTKLTQNSDTPVFGRNPHELVEMIGSFRGPDRLLDIQLRTGPYGDHFGSRNDTVTTYSHGDINGLSLDLLSKHPHGIDFGPLTSQLPNALRTSTGCIELAPSSLVQDVQRLQTKMRDVANASRAAVTNVNNSCGVTDAPLLMIGRRHLRSNNSWMHNVSVLVKGKPRCTMQMHPHDAKSRNIVDGDLAVIESSSANASIVVEVTDEVMQGVVSIPHGWGHDHVDARQRVAFANAGVNTNRLVPSDLIDVPSGNAVTNGVVVTVRKTAK